MSDKTLTARKIFKELGPNFMTPNLVKYYQTDDLVAELSWGKGFDGETLYGLTIRDHDGKDTGQSGLHTTRKAAERVLRQIGFITTFRAP